MKYRNEKERFSSFWSEFKSTIENQDWNKAVSFAYFPLTDESTIAMNNKWSKNVKDETDLIVRFKKFFSGNFLGEFGKFEAYRYEDSHPEFEGGVYIFHALSADLVFTEINGEFKMTKIFGPAG